MVNLYVFRFSGCKYRHSFILSKQKSQIPETIFNSTKSDFENQNVTGNTQC
jgi:hypothetical protein